MATDSSDARQEHRSTQTWDGITRLETLSEWAAEARQRIADAGRSYDWGALVTAATAHPEFVNATRLGGSSLYAPLHQVAHGGAPVHVAERLLALGAWRTLRNARGERPVDVAQRRAHGHLLGVLEPALARPVPPDVLSAMQKHFHAVIRERATELVDKEQLRLPELEPLLEEEKVTVWFAVPGMYGGFNYRLTEDGIDAKLVVESWCRVVGGSGQRHEITSAGTRLVEEGFV